MPRKWRGLKILALGFSSARSRAFWMEISAWPSCQNDVDVIEQTLQELNWLASLKEHQKHTYWNCETNHKLALAARLPAGPPSSCSSSRGWCAPRCPPHHTRAPQFVKIEKPTFCCRHDLLDPYSLPSAQFAMLTPKTVRNAHPQSSMHWPPHCSGRCSCQIRCRRRGSCLWAWRARPCGRTRQLSYPAALPKPPACEAGMCVSYPTAWASHANEHVHTHMETSTQHQV